MKTVLAVALFVGVALCNSTAFFGWTPHKEFIYRFESQVLTGIPEIESQYAGLKFASDVKVQTFDDYSLRIKFENPKYVVVNQKLSVREGRPLVPKPEQSLPESLRRHLETPFLVHLKRGVVENFFVEQEEPVIITNIKKSLLSQLQMDLTGSRRPEVFSNHITKSEQESLQEGITTFFSTFETSVLGDCETSYTINPIPGYQAQEIEERMKSSEKALMEEGIIAGEKSQGAEACRGKKYWEVVKTKNFDNCKAMPVYQSAAGIRIKCDFSRSECRDALTHTSTTRYVVCGSSPEEYYIREAITDNNILTNPLGWLASKEKMTSLSRVSLVLLKVRPSSFTPLPKPSQSKSERSLMFQYPKGELWSPYSATQAPTPGQETGKYGLEPLLPKPDLHSASEFFPMSMPISQLKEHVSSEMSKVVREIFKSPESCSSKSDIAGTISTIAYYLRPLSLESLKEIERSLHTSSYTPEQREIAQEIFLDILSMTGSNPATMLIKEKIERQELSNAVATKILQTVLRNIKTPTQELLKEIFQLVKSVESKPHVYNVGVVQLSNLINQACIDTNTQVSNYPVRIFGLFCKEDSEFVTREYIPYLVQKLSGSSSESEKLVILAALGKIGHRDILLPVVRLIEEPHSISPMGRSIAVYMLKRLANNEPTLVKPILLALINNPAENPEVRIAAVSVLPWTQPSVSDLQKIAVRSWFEPSKQVASFIYSTLKSIVHTEIPELKPVGQRARGILHTVKPFQYGIQFSKNMHTKNFVDYLRTASDVQITYVNSEKSYTPTKMSISSRLFGGAWEMNGMTFGIYSQGMDSLIDSVWQKLGFKSEVSQKVEEELEHITQKLNIKKREPQSPASFVHFNTMGYERVYSLNKEIYNEILYKVSEMIKNSHDLYNGGRHFNYTHTKFAVDIEAVGPSDTGFPIWTDRNLPVVAGIKGHIETEGQGEERSLKTRIIPVINAKIISNLGVVSPFEKEFIGSGVELSVHLTLPMTLKAMLSKGKELELSVQSPEEIQHQFEVVHAFVKPYTVKKNMQVVEPISKSPHVKTILSRPEPVKHVRPIGQTLGLKGLWTVETDYPTPVFSNFWNVIKQHNFFSLASFGFPSSVKYSSFKLEFNPSESSTKKIETVLGIVYGVRNSVSSVPTVYYPPHEGISEEKEREISIICHSRHPYSPRERQICQEQLQERLSSRKQIHSEALSLLESSSQDYVAGFNLEASIKSSSSRHTLNTAILIGGQEHGRDLKGSAKIMFTSPTAEKYEVNVNAETILPENKYWWSISNLIEQPMEASSKLVARFGPVGQSKKELSFEGKIFKSEAQKSSVKESTEFEICRDERLKGRTLASICEKVRHEASSVNKLEAKVLFPAELEKSWVINKVIYAISSELMPLITVEEMREESSPSSGSQRTLKITTEINRAGDIAQAWLESPRGKFELRNITVPRPIKGYFPLSLRNPVWTTLVQDISRDQAPASCRLDTRISTFDNLTYEYQLNDCYHLLFKDCSSFQSKIPLAVLAKGPNGSHKKVKVLSSRSIIELMPQRPGLVGHGVYVKVDGEEVPVPSGSKYVKRSPTTDRVILEIVRSHDGVVVVRNPIEGLQVFYDGGKLEIVAPQSLRSRACGLCGDLNGENTADIKAPEECVMSSPRLSAYSYIMVDGQCSGIPSQYREEYQKEKSECVKRHMVPTPLERLTKAVLMNKLKQESLVHLVEVQQNRICVSKFPIRSCPKSSSPSNTKPVEISFTCMVRTSSIAQQIVKRIKSGEVIPEVQGMPTTFSKVHHEPIKCERPISPQYTESIYVGY